MACTARSPALLGFVGFIGFIGLVVLAVLAALPALAELAVPAVLAVLSALSSPSTFRNESSGEAKIEGELVLLSPEALVPPDGTPGSPALPP